MNTVPLKHRLRFALALCVALGLWLLIQPAPAYAGEIVVTDTLDSGAGTLPGNIQTVADGCVTLTGIEAFSAWTLFDTSQPPHKPTAARVVALAARGLAPVAARPLAGLLALGGAATFFRRRRRL